MFIKIKSHEQIESLPDYFRHNRGSFHHNEWYLDSDKDIMVEITLSKFKGLREMGENSCQDILEDEREIWISSLLNECIKKDTLNSDDFYKSLKERLNLSEDSLYMATNTDFGYFFTLYKEVGKWVLLAQVMYGEKVESTQRRLKGELSSVEDKDALLSNLQLEIKRPMGGSEIVDFLYEYKFQEDIDEGLSSNILVAFCFRGEYHQYISKYKSEVNKVLGQAVQSVFNPNDIGITARIDEYESAKYITNMFFKKFFSELDVQWHYQDDYINYYTDAHYITDGNTQLFAMYVIDVLKYYDHEDSINMLVPYCQEGFSKIQSLSEDIENLIEPRALRLKMDNFSDWGKKVQDKYDTLPEKLQEELYNRVFQYTADIEFEDLEEYLKTKNFTYESDCHSSCGDINGEFCSLGWYHGKPTVFNVDGESFDDDFIQVVFRECGIPNYDHFIEYKESKRYMLEYINDTIENLESLKEIVIHLNDIYINLGKGVSCVIDEEIDQVLESIERENKSIAEFKELVSEYRKSADSDLGFICLVGKFTDPELNAYNVLDVRYGLDTISIHKGQRKVIQSLGSIMYEKYDEYLEKLLLETSLTSSALDTALKNYLHTKLESLELDKIVVFDSLITLKDIKDELGLKDLSDCPTCITYDDVLASAYEFACSQGHWGRFLEEFEVYDDDQKSIFNDSMKKNNITSILDFILHAGM